MTGMNDIEKLTKDYAEARDALATAAATLQAEISAVKRRYVGGLRKRVQQTTDARVALLSAVRENQGLFKRPKSRILHGIKVGYAKAIGKVIIRDEVLVVARIRKHFPDKFDELVKTTEKPVKDALGRLPAADLKRLGVTVEETVDRPVIKPADSEIDKLVDALLEGQDEEDGDG